MPSPESKLVEGVADRYGLGRIVGQGGVADSVSESLPTKFRATLRVPAGGSKELSARLYVNVRTVFTTKLPCGP